MGQPHLPGRSLPAQPCRLLERHMLIFPGLGRLLLFSVHALADKQIVVLCVFRDHRHRPGIRGICNGKAPPGLSQDHIRRQDPPFMLQGLPLLEPAPHLLGDPLCLCPFHIKTALSGNGDPVSVAGHIVVHLKGIDHKGACLELLPGFRQLPEHQRKRKLRRNGP